MAQTSLRAQVTAVEFKGNLLVARWTSGPGEEDVTFFQTGRPHNTAQQAVAAAFLPEGYPESVTPDYLRFQIWDSSQALCSYVRGILSSQAILAGVGVGQEAATPLSAVFQFFMRDFMGMLGGILFASFQGSNLDSYAKQWRLFADCMNNVGMALELASPHFPAAFLYLACLGSMARAITGVAGGATRAALTQHFAKQKNAADIAAKEGSQETATTLIGMVLGMVLTQICAGSPLVLWAAFLTLTFLHIYCNMRAMKTLHMTTLNRVRLEIVLEAYIRQGIVLTPAAVAAAENLTPPPLLRLLQLLKRQRRWHIMLGARLSEVVGLSATRVQSMCMGSVRQKYLISTRPTQWTVDVVLSKDVSNWDLVAAYLHAHLLCLAGNTKLQVEPEQWLKQRWSQLQAGLREQGWTVDGQRLPLGQQPWRAAWGAGVHAHLD